MAATTGLEQREVQRACALLEHEGRVRRTAFTQWSYPYCYEAIETETKSTT
jgi:hypothetical protein